MKYCLRGRDQSYNIPHLHHQHCWRATHLQSPTPTSKAAHIKAPLFCTWLILNKGLIAWFLQRNLLPALHYRALIQYINLHHMIWHMLWQSKIRVYNLLIQKLIFSALDILLLDLTD